ncbi:hypothetical protein CPB84DRAFT_1850140 [Gymnopilus junonius]|uniref:Uncharacterized protein n=1 Tax=Gymnopilus junonius TaxID=109634 RepID=A0A9P5TK73_GYMJU|nr:hypothetical protein CPB84DRAFT_1850140 [Gymnopilus junonius]
MPVKFEPSPPLTSHPSTSGSRTPRRQSPTPPRGRLFHRREISKSHPHSRSATDVDINGHHSQDIEGSPQSPNKVWKSKRRYSLVSSTMNLHFTTSFIADAIDPLTSLS